MQGNKKAAMRIERKSAVKNSVGRLVFVLLIVLLQILWLFFLAMVIRGYSTLIETLLNILSLIVVIRMYGNRTNAAIKMPWIMLILAFPLAGLFLYGLFGSNKVARKKRMQIEAIDRKLNALLKQEPEILEELKEQDLAVANQAGYLVNYGQYPVWKRTSVSFYADASEGFQAQLKALKEAKSFIFLEYHAIEDASSFAEMKEILIQKAAEGVEVRLFYDDVGCIVFLNPEFIRQMRENGIDCRVFNPVAPIFNMFMNNRDHRKILVIDGKVGFTGGYNLADEYFNITHPYGHWKDTGVRLCGDAVRSLTVMFLEMWNAIAETDTDYEKYLQMQEEFPVQEGYVQPYACNPLTEERVGENVYLNIIKNAKRYLYFMTPYLIITDDMNRELGLAAKRGVDVRILTPGIPDKKLVYRVTRSYYSNLVRQGVRIYEYTPGFCHAKQCVCDDEIVTVGTINLDYRSLYLHFENGVFFYRGEIISEVLTDFENTFAKSAEVTEQYRSGKKAGMKLGQCVLRMIAPLM